MLPCIFEEGSRLKSRLAFCTCSNIKTHREEKGHCSSITEVRTHLKNSERAWIPASHCDGVSVAPYFTGFTLLMRILTLIILFAFFVSGSSC